jgi:hypothetical protein
MKIFNKYILRIRTMIFIISIILGFNSCNSFWAGFGSYEKPRKNSNKYYKRNFTLTNKNLVIGKKYYAIQKTGIDSNENNYTFYANGFVIHNNDNGKEEIGNLNYSKIYSEDIGSYLIINDTIFWGTRPGYMKRKNINYYKAIIEENKLKVLSSTKYRNVVTFELKK